MRLALSTSICPAPLDPRRIIERSREVLEGRGAGLALDGRLSVDEARLTLERLRGAEVRCVELTQMVASAIGRPLPSPLSSDRDERRAASQALARTISLAGEQGVSRVLLLPWPLALSVEREELRRRFARGEAIELEALGGERAARGAVAMDGLQLVLDASLRLAEGLGVQLTLATPAPWPQQCPSADEVKSLGAVFAGAPIVTSHCTDWAHVAELLGAPAGDPAHAASLRLADASGLRLKLPPGLGEIDWLAALRGVPADDGVVTAGADSTVAELTRSFALLEGEVDEPSSRFGAPGLG
jgi:hypothetical protein